MATLFARGALAAGFLSAVADRFGLWGPPGTAHVAWGAFDAFRDYTHHLAPYLPDSLVGPAAWVATVVEVVLGAALLLGIGPRWTAAASAALLFVFAVSMFAYSGFETPFSASVFSAAATALLLMGAPGQADVLSLNRALLRRKYTR
ncbi:MULTISPECIES: MauE/DoxX family redox-associated membrane protein [unclassified Nocardia]|uniref:MauE/DoxX family redox-associated membrane protein n=1 Tax=unclassified Nocardia TaxID=2637762 RepID=UPI001CE3C44B|nr:MULTISPECIES: MauE/DoxX family redox-associated membrane protein [unclassified Nocardia]